MARICQEKGVIMVADEIHGDLIRRDKIFTPVAKVAASQDHILTCTAINKTFNVAGLHGTNMIIPNEKLRKVFQQEQRGVMASPFTIAAVIAAYTECEEWLEEIKEYFDGTIEWVMAFLKKEMPPVKFVRPEGTYIFWMDFRAYGLSPEEIRKKIYVDANVILESGVMFDPDRGAGFERICLSSPPACYSGSL
jgi:cystathionine beta-lyase